LNPALTALAQLLGQTVGTAASLVGWVAVAHYWLGISTETALLAFIAFAISGVGAAIFAQNQRAQEPHLPPERDFYVVTNDRYRWDLTRRRPTALKPELGGTIYAYDTLAAAEMKFRQLEAEHPPLDLEDCGLWYHENVGYDEEEARLWVVYTRSKPEAYDKVWYDDSRRRLGHDGRTDDLLLVTNNAPRQQQYLAWWRHQMDLAREQEEIEAKMTYDAAIALFGFEESPPPPPNTLRCEEVKQFDDKLRSKCKELNALTTRQKATAVNSVADHLVSMYDEIGDKETFDRKTTAAISRGYGLISKRISDARACGKYGPCTIHVRKEPSQRAGPATEAV
jgi:hypothetical protein